jgi:hypothetical protein
MQEKDIPFLYRVLNGFKTIIIFSTSYLIIRYLTLDETVRQKFLNSFFVDIYEIVVILALISGSYSSLQTKLITGKFLYTRHILFEITITLVLLIFIEWLVF